MTQQEALLILTTGVNVFLTGEPGAGKSYTVRQYVHYLQQHGIPVALTASTGIAATHIGGMTIHSWSGLGIRKTVTRAECKELAGNATVRRRIVQAAVLIIDEVSMLDASMVEALDLVCRVVRGVEEPFGGLQVVFVGDFFQLPPVSRAGEVPPRFAFEARAWMAAQCTVCYLTEQHRQEDATFLAVLSAVRRGVIDEDHLATLTERQRVPKDVEMTKLYSHNADVDRINADHLRTLAGKPRTFTMTTYGNAKVVEQLKKGCLSPEELVVKVGARVMCTRNSPQQGFVNGSLGEVTGFDPDSGLPVVTLATGKVVTVEPEMWSVDGDGGGGIALAALRQVPLRLAWAITVHKSQGMSLDAAHIDLRGAFAYGQGYVALSRVRTLRGLYLAGLNARALQVDPVVLAMDEEFREQSRQAGRELAARSEAEIAAARLRFVAVHGGAAVAPVRPSSAKVKGPKWAPTVALLREGKTLEQIAVLRERTVGTILDHVREAHQLGELSPEVLATLCRQEAQLLERVEGVFAAQDTPALKPIFEHFHGAISYDQLRIAQWLRTVQL